MKFHPTRIVALLAASTALLVQTSLATPFDFIRIGDKDGFGINPTGLKRATPTHTTAADTNGNGILEQGEFLPDWNLDGTVAFNSNDNFDNRTAGEIADTVVQGSGFSASTGTTGSKWTDLSLSTTMPALNFPDPAGPGTPNEPLFSFRFEVAKTDIIAGSTLFFNLIYGDYDVTPANVLVTKNNGAGAAGAASTISLTSQPTGEDGLIQAAFLSLGFSDVFSDGGSVWVGYLDVKFQAPNEPYTAFDFAELSLDQIPLETPSTPDSGGTLVLLGSALLVSAGFRRYLRPTA